MRRLADEQLLSWKNSLHRKPLLVRGARQVGKTFSIERFGKDNFARILKVDLERHRDWHHIFGGDLGAEHILAQLELVLQTKIEAHGDLLFFDEIQACPRAIMALRYLYEDRPELSVVAAGSLLEFALGEISFPVGRIQFLEMYPITFREYLWAVGKDPMAQMISEAPKALPELAHQLLLEELRRYCFVGGLPAAVTAYAETKSFQAAAAAHREIAYSYEQDFSKYSPKVDVYCLDAVYRSVARRTGQQIKYTKLAEGFSLPTIKKAFDLLVRARIVTRVAAAHPGGLPLGATASARKFKALMVDIGLWQHLCGISPEEEYWKSDLLDIYRGAMAEQFVGQELLAAQASPLYCWMRETPSSESEVDFLVVARGRIHPIEVKSGSAGRLKSLHLMLEGFPHCPSGLVFSSAPYAELPGQKLKFLPLYYAGIFPQAGSDQPPGGPGP